MFIDGYIQKEKLSSLSGLVCGLFFLRLARRTFYLIISLYLSLFLGVLPA